MKVFADFHHEALYYSLHLLFEKRLGWELYRPIREEWFNEGYWKIAEPYGNSPGTITQYLGIRHEAWDAETNLNGDYKLEDGVYHIYNPGYGFHHKAITLEKFKEMEIDIVIASYVAHIGPYAELIRRFKPKAKLIHQMGNNWVKRVNFGDVKNLMASTNVIPVPGDVNVVFYHQEFPLDVFRYESPSQDKKIASFVHVLPTPDVYNAYKAALPEYEFHAYGAACPDGCVNGIDTMADTMRDQMFGFHNKPGGDGYGHVLFSWYAVGRPVIINYNDYKNQLGGALLIPDETCIDIGEGVPAVCEKIRHFSDPDRHKKMSERCFARFKEVVNFDAEQKPIEDFLAKLI